MCALGFWLLAVVVYVGIGWIGPLLGGRNDYLLHVACWHGLWVVCLSMSGVLIGLLYLFDKLGKCAGYW